MDLKGWKRTGDAIESGGLVDQDRVDVQKGILVLPLVQASSHRAEVSFSLRRATTRDPSRLQLPLPVPSADSVGTGELAVHAAPGLDLLPDLSNSTGISAAPVSQELNVSTSDGGTELHFRTLLPASVFVTDRVNRAREISTRSTTQIDIAQNTAQIEQRIEYTDRFEPVTELAFDVPYDVPSGSGGPDIVLLTATANTDSKIEEQGTPLHPNLPNDEPTTSSESETHEVRVMLPRPQIGTFVARIRYRYPMPKTTVADTRLAIPLIHPVDGDLTSNYFAIHAPRNLIINLDNDDESASWKPARSPTENNTPSTKLALVADSPELYLPLLIRSGRPDVPSSTIVDRVWLQTWLSNDTEQDRAAFRFRTAGSQITVELPYELPTDEIELLVDHQPAEVLSQAHGRLVVSLGPSAAGVVSEANSPVVAHTLELRSRHSYRHNVLTWHRLTPPQIEGSTALSQLYWQIVLPGDEHVIAPPAQLAPASQWQWLGTFWGRRPLKSQAELEEWVSASSQLTPADAQNQYLFTGLMPASTIELATGPRWMIVLVASAVVLGFSVACLYVPVGRRTWLLAAIALVIVVAAISFPAAALILAQASVIGVALAALGLILSRFVGRRGRIPTAPVVSPSSQRVVTPRADSFLLSPAIAASSTSPTTTLRSADSER